MNKYIKWLLIIAGVGALAGAFIYNMANKDTAVISEVSPDLQYDINELVAKFTADKEGFNQTHLEKILSFKSTVITLVARPEGGGTARLQSPDPSIDINIQLDDRMNYEHIMEGDELDFKGVYVGYQEDILEEGFFEMVFQRGYFEKEQQ
jgi:hypothetical protein